MDAPATTPAKRYINRELSLIEFNRRVLAQATDESVPLLERLRFFVSRVPTSTNSSKSALPAANNASRSEPEQVTPGP